MSILAQLVICLAIFAAGAAGGIKWHAGQDAIKENERLNAQAAIDKARATVAHQGATGHEADKTIIETKYQTITKEVERVVNKIEYRDRGCFDADGLRLHADAIKLTGNTSEPGDAVPTPAAPK